MAKYIKKMEAMKYKLKQVFIPYYKWEDFLNGMWRNVSREEEEEFLKQCVAFTSDHLVYGMAMKKVIDKWPNTMLNSMTNININRRAFLGHCACSYEFNCPEYITRLAWGKLTDNQRFFADRVAQQTIDNWIQKYNEKKNRRLHKRMGTQMLLQWPSG